jgi:uncharacterized protein (TIGR02231 family)
MGSTPFVILDAPLHAVLLYEDRALVSRRGRVALPAGPSRLRVEPVSPVLSDRSLRVAVLAGAEHLPSLPDLRARRERLAREADLPEDLRVLRADERARVESLWQLQQRQAMRQAELEDLRHQRAQRIADAVTDAAWSVLRPEATASDLAALGARERALQAEILESGWAITEANEDLERLRRRIAAAEHPLLRYAAWIEIDLTLASPGEITLEISYLVPGACWRPRYRATLREGPAPSLALEAQAAVWQHTGEDWRDVRLAFSTQRPSLGSEPPSLAEDLLQVRPRSETVVVETREQVLQDTGFGGEGPRQVDDDLPGVDDGGEPVDLRAEGLATVLSDGQPHRVALGAFEAPAAVDRYVAAELCAAAIQRCTSRNAGTRPLLAGPVDLIARSGRVGRGKIGFVAVGERFELGFGPDPAVRVLRRDERSEKEPGALSRWRVTEHAVEVKLSNLGVEPRLLTVQERVPISELSQVEIEVEPEGTTGGQRPNADGLLSWEIELSADGTATVELAWKMKRRSDVVER